MDDATSEIYSAFFVAEEGTMSSFVALLEVGSAMGLFCSLYADRASHYWHTPEAGGKVDKDNPTQVGRALQQLGIELIPAYSPEARGRSERMFGTSTGLRMDDATSEIYSAFFRRGGHHVDWRWGRPWGCSARFMQPALLAHAGGRRQGRQGQSNPSDVPAATRY